ncbi:MAG: hypothetical protein KGL53_10505 [Elusimicrobia bacterium]|nr:hypothetical protein [Elusimicrobiota bacterium]
MSLAAAPARAQGYGADPTADTDQLPDDQSAEPAPTPASAAARPAPVTLGDSSGEPIYLSLADSINNFGRFADGGSDSNWYVGFDNAWVVKLPPAPAGGWTRAFVGAKLGRAKTEPRKDHPWEQRVIPGKVYVAVSQRPAFSSEQSFFLADTGDIPLEPRDNSYLPGVGRSEWFWAEVPRAAVSTTGPNYVIIWSPTSEFRSAESAPILAAADSLSPNAEPSAWNNHNIQGVPPRDEADSLPVPITLKPALAIKLVPPAASPVTLSAFSVRDGAQDVAVRFSVSGRDVELAWVESSDDQLEWTRVSGYRREPPYIFSLPVETVTGKGTWLRARARDAWANEGTSAPLFVPGPEAP